MCDVTDTDKKKRVQINNIFLLIIWYNIISFIIWHNIIIKKNSW